MGIRRLKEVTVRSEEVTMDYQRRLGTEASGSLCHPDVTLEDGNESAL
jgi:hypothetical protein